MVSASFTASETLPVGVTATDLLGSTTYVNVKKTALAAALSTTVSKVTITSFTISSRQLTEFVGRALATASKTVTTNFGVETADASAATTLKASLEASDFSATLKTQLDTAASAADYSNDSFFASDPPVLGAVSAVSAPVVANAPTPAPKAPAKKTSLGARQSATIGVSVTLVAAAFVTLF